MKQLWEMLLSAQNSISGIPQVLLEAKKQEIRLQRVLDILLLNSYIIRKEKLHWKKTARKGDQVESA